MKADHLMLGQGGQQSRPADQREALEHLLATRRLFLFDGVCALCNASVRFVMRHERQPDTAFVSMQSPLGQQLLSHFDLPLAGWDSFILIEKGVLYFKSSGFIRVAAALRQPWCWMAWIRAIPRTVRDWGYDRVARNRYRLFGKYDRCMLPDPAVANRFPESL